MTIAPWHMWGGQASVNATTLTPGITFRTQGQLARIQYHRPESWRFLLYARILESSSASPALFQVDFQIIPGVGRASLNFGQAFDGGAANLPFERFVFRLPIGVGAAQTKWSGSVLGPVRDDTADPADATRSTIDTIVAQDFQVSYSAQVVLTVPGNHVTAEVGAVFAPWHHARPDWQIHKFTGEELGGR